MPHMHNLEYPFRRLAAPGSGVRGVGGCLLLLGGSRYEAATATFPFFPWSHSWNPGAKQDSLISSTLTTTPLPKLACSQEPIPYTVEPVVAHTFLSVIRLQLRELTHVLWILVGVISVVAPYGVITVGIFVAEVDRLCKCSLRHDALSKIFAVCGNGREIWKVNGWVYKPLIVQNWRKAARYGLLWHNHYPIISVGRVPMTNTRYVPQRLLSSGCRKTSWMFAVHSIAFPIVSLSTRRVSHTYHTSSDAYCTLKGLEGSSMVV